MKGSKDRNIFGGVSETNNQFTPPPKTERKNPVPCLVPSYGSVISSFLNAYPVRKPSGISFVRHTLQLINEKLFHRL